MLSLHTAKTGIHGLNAHHFQGVEHYRNGRVAQNGDIVISLDGYGSQVINAVGVLHSAVAGNDYCNGSIAPIQQNPKVACLIDCLHIDDVLAILAEKGLDKRPEGK